MNYWFVFSKGCILLQYTKEGIYTIPFQEKCPVEVSSANSILSLPNMSDGRIAKAVEIDEMPKLNGFNECGLRQSYYKLPLRMYLMAGKASELLYWYRNTRFCGVCGSPMEMTSEISKRCPNCGKSAWPQLATAIIVLISRNEELLLVHARNFKSDFYGCVAGFVETGESLEEAVIREVKEETSLTIKNLRYFKSQPWPYPCGLMVGFFAEYADGELKLQNEELSKGGWFKKDELPTIPEKLSLARMLIDHWLDENNNKNY